MTKADISGTSKIFQPLAYLSSWCPPCAAAMALESREEIRKSPNIKRSIWNKWISEREEVISAVLVCTVTSIILIVLVITGNSALVCYF